MCHNAEATHLQCQDLEKKDSNPEKSDEETEKKAKNDEDEVEEEEYDEEDIEEVRKHVLDELNLSYKKKKSFLRRKTTTLTAISTMGKTLEQAAMTTWTVKRRTEPT